METLRKSNRQTKRKLIVDEKDEELEVDSEFLNFSNEKDKRKNKFTKEQIHDIIRKGEPEVKVKCSVCDENFDYIYDLLEHREIEHSHEVMLTCTNCGETFEKKAQLYNHLILELEAYKCHRCENCFKTKALFDFHNNTAKCPVNYNNTKIPIKCSECDEVFSNIPDLLNHRLLKYGEEIMLTCGLCKQKFAKKGGIHRHLNLEYNSYQCSSCGRALRDKFRLTQHEAKCCNSSSSSSSIEPTAENLKCHTCGMTSFVNIPQLLSHISEKHGREKMLTCGICGLMFKSRTGILRHLNIEYKLYNCENCGKSIGEKYLLVKHQEICKNSFSIDVLQQIVNCEEKASGSQSNEEMGEERKNNTTMQNLIDQLIKGEDSENNEWNCEVCESIFQSAAELFIHKTNCGHEKLIECVQCQFKNSDQNEIDKHRDTVHNKQKFECSFCDLIFVNHRQLSDHHNKELRIYVCQTCNESFRSQLILDKHRKTHPTCRQFFGISKS
ncbi:unnamed protein product [Caenorhabditis angaria]|uniref:C2H2-type domain-containing protein n=1 Tax=Caenorhabditis angaria TaxID=860376 RepID=A0A9P1MVK2_9PELO|nr:unnamed protein product [Caenorhabditis angaria]